MMEHLDAALRLVAPNLSSGGPVKAGDFLVTIYIAFGLLLLRAVSQAVVLPGLSAAFRRRMGDAGPKAAFGAFDNFWIALFAGALCVYAWVVTLGFNGGCKPWDTRTCLQGWPDHPVDLQQRWYMLLMFGYYLYEMIGTAVNVGTKLKADMLAHHVVTMVLIYLAYMFNIVRMCCMWTALFDLSNPILHLAKMQDKLKVPSLEGLKWATFVTFALSFLVCRVIMGPFSIVWPAFTQGASLPPPIRYPCQGMIIFIYTLQLIWFYKIVQIAIGKDKNKED